MRDWTTANTFPWMPTTANVNYVVGIWARSSGNVTDAPEKSAIVAFAIGTPP